MCVLFTSIFAIGLMSARQASADQLVYDNGVPNSQIAELNISDLWVSDSFTVSSPVTLNLAQAALTPAGVSFFPTSLSWSIGTTPDGSQISSGTSNIINNTFWGTVSYNGSPIYESQFAITGTLAANTKYYFTLQNAMANGTNPLADGVLWDVNNGPSTMIREVYGSDYGSESFQLYAAPEPCSWALGLLSIGTVFVLRYRALRN